MKESIKIEGHSVGDPDVGMFPCYFSIDTGMLELTKDDKEFLIKGVIRDLWELHDNGTLVYGFSDETDPEMPWGHTRRMRWEDSQKILEAKRGDSCTAIDAGNS